MTDDVCYLTYPNKPAEKINEMSIEGAYDTRQYYETVRIK
ncbi:hypothetical protein BTN50_0190 [Candidatus Enterovibrio altilux]|uniref:Mobile element protein n=1 Tax=Candidatus Enterovibrio altilux TaxID=1927128 RepID=A0A291B6V2_9GAMM|nr:hypothetical protein BTN50_0190 [Candidatus Enterovibrio luxaltus]